MNITKEIHLAHTKFTIDKDAYTILETYLNKLAIAFNSNSSKEEILEDIEIRLAEIFSEKRNTENFVLSVKEINVAIETLGSPELLSEEEENEDEESKKKNYNRKLYRDLEDNYIGGVASGLSHYFGIETVWLRILFIIFFFIPIPFTTITYLIIWAITPSAKTNADKIRMRGGTVNLNSIKKKIESVLPEIEKEIVDFDKNYAKGIWEKVKYFLKKSINISLITIKKLAKLLTVFLGFLMMLGSFISGLLTLSFVVFISAVKSGMGTAKNLNYSVFTETIEINNAVGIDILEIFSSFNSIFTIIFIGLLLIIPCVFLFIVGLKLVSKNNYTVHNMTFFTLTAMWIISLMYFIYKFAINTVNGWHIVELLRSF